MYDYLCINILCRPPYILLQSGGKKKRVKVKVTKSNHDKTINKYAN